MVELRTLTDDEMPALRRLDDSAFGHHDTDSRWLVASAVLERARQTGAFAGGELVGHTAAFTQVLTVPGGAVPCAGVTWVGVSPTHRRRGVMSALITDQLASLHETGEPVAALWAAEPGIYGRFGFGIASRMATVTADRGPRLDGPHDADLGIRLGTVPELIEQCIAVHEAVRPTRPGMVTRSLPCWHESSYDEPSPASPSSGMRCAVVADAAGDPQGYAWFRTTPRWSAGIPEGSVEVREMVAASPTATRALLDLVLDLDLMARTSFWNLPLDHPLVPWTQYSVRVRPTIAEQLWVRLVRLDEALASRTYARPIDVVLEVADERCPWNAGRWRLSGDSTGAEVHRTSDAADLALDSRDLAAAYLGDDTVRRDLAAGLLPEVTPGTALTLADAMRGEVPPWCASMF